MNIIKRKVSFTSFYLIVFTRFLMINDFGATMYNNTCRFIYNWAQFIYIQNSYLKLLSFHSNSMDLFDSHLPSIPIHHCSWQVP